MGARYEGKIKWFSARGFGYLLGADNREIFVHRDDCAFEPEADTLVEYELGSDRLGRSKAVKVIKKSVRGRAFYEKTH